MPGTHQALYRLFRPRTFSEMVGQNVARQTLRNQVRTGKIAHAYLLCGTRGTGKTSAAKILSRAVNCENPQDGDPCCQCPACRSILNNTCLDVVEMDAASNSRVEDMRALLEKAAFPPQAVRHKVYIIDEVHMLSNSAFNALLKTLEEPPEYLIFILATTDPRKLPPTILSRCQRFDFGRLSLEEIMGRLREVMDSVEGEADEEALYRIAQAAEGGMRDALSILDQCLGMTDHVTDAAVRGILGASDRETLLNLAEAIGRNDAAQALRLTEQALRSGADPRGLIMDLEELYRDLLTAALCGADPELLRLPREEAEQLAGIAGIYTVPHLQRALGLMMKADGNTRYSASQQGVLQMAVLQACRPTDGRDIAALEEKVAELERTMETMAREGIRLAPSAQEGPGAPAEPGEPHRPLPRVTDKTGNEIWNEAMQKLKRESSVISLLRLGVRYAGFRDGEYTVMIPAGDTVPVGILNMKIPVLLDALKEAGAQDPKIRILQEGTRDAKEHEKMIWQIENELFDVFGREDVVVIREEQEGAR